MTPPTSTAGAPATSKLGRKYCLRRQTADSRDFVFVPHPDVLAAPLPASVDLSEQVLPAVDQGDIGSCTANSAAVILRYLLRKEKVGDWLPSRLFLYYMTRVEIEGVPADEDSGAMLRDVARALRRYHDCDEQCWPYDTTKFNQTPPQKAMADASRHKQIRFEAVPQDLLHFKACLVHGFPIHIGIQVFESFESDEVARTGMVPMPDPMKEQCLGGHALAVVGYRDDIRCFIVVNSWGAWGYEQKGLCFIPYEYMMSPEIGSTDSWTYKLFA